MSTAVQTAGRSQGSGTERAAPGSSPPNRHAETATTYAPHTSTSDHVVLSSRPLHPPPPLMWDTLESPGNSPGERRRVDLCSSRRRGLPLIPVASRLLLQPPTVDFNHIAPSSLSPGPVNLYPAAREQHCLPFRPAEVLLVTKRCPRRAHLDKHC